MRGNAAQAIPQYTEALKDQTLTNDRRGALLNDRAVAYARSGQIKLAIDDFNRAVQLYPEHAATYNNRGNLLLGLALSKEEKRIHPPDPGALHAAVRHNMRGHESN